MDFKFGQKMSTVWQLLQRNDELEMQKNSQKKQVFGHVFSRVSRRAFERWKRASEKASCEIDVNDYGPVVERGLAERLRLKAC